MDTATLILSIAAIALSIFTIVISWVLFNKSDKLNKEMMTFIVEIKTLTRSIHKDSFGLLKRFVEKSTSQESEEGNKLISLKTVQEIVEKTVLEFKGKFSGKIDERELADNQLMKTLRTAAEELEKTLKSMPKNIESAAETMAEVAEKFVLDKITKNPGITVAQLISQGLRVGIMDYYIVRALAGLEFKELIKPQTTVGDYYDDKNSFILVKDAKEG